MNITSPISHEALCYVGLVYVDDDDFPKIAHNTKETAEQVALRHQTTVTTWAGYVLTSRGALTPSKCFWYPIKWTWKGGNPTCPLQMTHTCKFRRQPLQENWPM